MAESHTVVTRKNLASAGLGVFDFAALCGVDRTTVWRWFQHEAPEYARNLLALWNAAPAAARQYVLDDARRIAGSSGEVRR